MRSILSTDYLKPISRAVADMGFSIADVLNGIPGPLNKWLGEVVALMARGASGKRQFDYISMKEKDLARLEELLRPIHFKIYPRGPIRRGEWVMDLTPVDNLGGQGGLALMLWRLGTAGAMPRFRRCENCSAHFFATRKSQKFCTVDCREEHHRSQPEYKEAQRKRVRALYYKKHPKKRERSKYGNR